VKVTVSSPKPAKVFFRIPSWSRQTFVDGVKAGTGWFETRVEGEKTFALAFDMTPVIVDSKNPETHNTKKDWPVIRWCSGKQMPFEMYRQTPAATIKYGPILLRAQQACGSTDARCSRRIDRVKHAVCRLSPATSDAVDYAWNAEIKTDAGTIRTKVCDYASGTDDPSDDDERFFSIFF
jgi:hypothetical protein